MSLAYSRRRKEIKREKRRLWRVEQVLLEARRAKSRAKVDLVSTPTATVRPRVKKVASSVRAAIQ